VTLRDIAQAAGTSPAAVSLALAGSPKVGDRTKAHILALCEELGYDRRHLRRAPVKGVRARALRVGLLTFGAALDDETLIPFLKALTGETACQGARLELATVASTESLEMMRTQLAAFAAELDGVLLYGLVSQELRRACRDLPQRFIMIGHGLSSRSTERTAPLLSSVVSNPQDMGQQATEFLLAQGHERLGFAASWMPEGMFAARWLDGYRLAHHHSRVPLDPSRIFCSQSPLAPGPEAAEYFLALPEPPTAYVVSDSLAAAGLRDALQERGHPLAADALVVCSSEDDAFRHRLTAYPRLNDDFPALAAEALRLLTADRQRGRPVQVVVPGRATGFESSP
jgi:LacI family transcriptional regulator